MNGIIKQLPFRIERDGKNYADAICLPEEEFDKLTEQDIEAIKEERFTNWLKVINTPQPEVSPEKQLEDVEAQITSLDEQKEILLKSRVELTAKVELLPVKESELPIKGK